MRITIENDLDHSKSYYAFEPSREDLTWLFKTWLKPEKTIKSSRLHAILTEMHHVANLERGSIAIQAASCPRCVSVGTVRLRAERYPDIERFTSLCDTCKAEVTRMVLLRILEKAETLIVKGWTQGAGARNAEGGSVLTRDPDATHWSLGGAIESARMDVLGAAYNEDNDRLLRSALICAIGERYETSWAYIEAWHDTPGRQRETVIAVVRKAMESFRG